MHSEADTEGGEELEVTHQTEKPDLIGKYRHQQKEGNILSLRNKKKTKP